MNRLVVEIGMKLDKNLVYYHELLTKIGAKLAFSCITHDYYYSKRHMEGLTENEMKRKCIRLRNVSFKNGYKIQNNLIDELELEVVQKEELTNFENLMMSLIP